jgi:hypothetical protein
MYQTKVLRITDITSLSRNITMSYPYFSRIDCTNEKPHNGYQQEEEDDIR